MRKLLISLVILILLVSGIIVVFNSSKNGVQKEYGKISVIATIYPIYDFAREIAGDKASVSMLLSPGVVLLRDSVLCLCCQMLATVFSLYTFLLLCFLPGADQKKGGALRR